MISTRVEAARLTAEFGGKGEKSRVEPPEKFAMKRGLMFLQLLPSKNFTKEIQTSNDKVRFAEATLETQLYNPHTLVKSMLSQVLKEHRKLLMSQIRIID